MVDPPPTEKERLRQRVWDSLSRAGALRPSVEQGHFPDVRDAERAAAQLAEERVFERAQVLWIVDAPSLHPVMELALAAGKTVVIAEPTRPANSCFMVLDPSGIPRANRATAAAPSSREPFGRRAAPPDVPVIELVVAAAVAVDPSGGRLGAGTDHTDLVFGLLRELGRISVKTPLAAVVHPSQVLREPLPMDLHDAPVDLIVSAEGSLITHSSHSRPACFYSERVTQELAHAVPFAGERLGQGGTPGFG